MKIRWSHLLFPLAGAALSATLVSVAFWDSAKVSLLTALSVIAAGVLVRLARGLPFTNPDHFELDEIRQVTGAAKQSIRALRALVVIVFAAMGWLVFASPITSHVTELLGDDSTALTYIDPTVSGIVGLLLTYVFVRIFSVVGGDVGLVDLQSTFLVRAVERKQADRFVETQKADETPRIKNPKNYGKIIQ